MTDHGHPTREDRVQNRIRLVRRGPARAVSGCDGVRVANQRHQVISSAIGHLSAPPRSGQGARTDPTPPMAHHGQVPTAWRVSAALGEPGRQALPRAAQHRRSVGCGQAIPREQPHRFLFLVREAVERGEDSKPHVGCRRLFRRPQSALCPAPVRDGVRSDVSLWTERRRLASTCSSELTGAKVEDPTRMSVEPSPATRNVSATTSSASAGSARRSAYDRPQLPLSERAARTASHVRRG